MEIRYDASQPWHVLQVQGGKEEYVKKFLSENFTGVIPFLPKRILLERRRGKMERIVKPLFPGYLFFTGHFTHENLTLLHKATFFKKILYNESCEFARIPHREMEFLFSLTGGSDFVDISDAAFDENDRIRVISGPLKEMEFSITKVDRRRQRVTAVIEFFNEFREITLSYDVIEKS